MNLPVANAVQYGSNATAMGLRNEVVFVALRLRYCPIAQRANYFLRPRRNEMTTFSLNLFFLNAPSHRMNCRKEPAL
jgi:hypothetical protein